jgi:hypothetical protein
LNYCVGITYNQGLLFKDSVLQLLTLQKKRLKSIFYVQSILGHSYGIWKIRAIKYY